jgi:hypothetical protein
MYAARIVNREWEMDSAIIFSIIAENILPAPWGLHRMQILWPFTSCTHNWLHDEKQFCGKLFPVGRRGSIENFRVLLVKKYWF